MTEKALEKPGEDEINHSQYNEEAFNQMVDEDEDANLEEEPELSDFPEESGEPEGSKEGDGKTDTDSEDKPKGEEDPEQQGEADTKGEREDDPDSDKDDGPELPAWMQAIPEDQREAAVTDYLNLQKDLQKLDARYRSQQGQLGPTQKKLTKLETLVKKFSSALKPGDGLDERTAELDAWIKKHGEDYPEEAEELKALVDAFRESTGQLVDESELDDSDDEVDRQTQIKLLHRMDNDAAQISYSPEFKAYLEQNSEHAAQAQSPFAHDVIEVLDQFREETNWQPPTRSEQFVNINQMYVSPIFDPWAQAIGLNREHVQGLSVADQLKVFKSFKNDLDEVNKGNDDDLTDNGDTSKAARLAKQRAKRKNDFSPAARSTGTGGGNPSALRGKEYFDQLEV